MNRDSLEQLASNPHYKMTDEQIDQLSALRHQEVKHITSIPKHPTGFDKHDPELRKEGDDNSTKSD